MDFPDIFTEPFIPKKQNTHSFPNAHGTFSKTDHMIGHKTSLKKFNKIEIISILFSDYKGLKPETNLKEKTQQFIFMEIE